MKVLLEVSARHIHISQNDLEKLFGKGYKLEKHIKELSQSGEYAEEETVKIIGPKNSYEKVRILGPIREHTQIELSMSDCFYLGINAPTRLSSYIKDSGSCKLAGPKGELELKEGVIVAKRHVHINTKQAKKEGIKNGDILKVKIEGERGLLFDNVIARVSDKYNLSVHLDTDEGNAAGIKTGDQGELII